MAYKVDGIKSQDELEKAQASANANGTTVANYEEWSKILKDLDEAGVKSTGSFAGDKAKLQEVESTIKEYVEKVQKVQKEQAVQQQQEPNKVEESSKNDGQQQIKATVANATSSVIMADYMKYYHLLG